VNFEAESKPQTVKSAARSIYSRAASALAEGDTNNWLSELKQESVSDPFVLKFITDTIHTRNKQWKKRILKEEGFFKAPTAGEVDMR